MGSGPVTPFIVLLEKFGGNDREWDACSIGTFVDIEFPSIKNKLF